MTCEPPPLPSPSKAPSLSRPGPARPNNTGARHGTCVPQLYLTDPIASVTRPIRQLIGFTRVDLEPAATRLVEFEIHADLTGLPSIIARAALRTADGSPAVPDSRYSVPSMHPAGVQDETSTRDHCWEAAPVYGCWTICAPSLVDPPETLRARPELRFTSS